MTMNCVKEQARYTLHVLTESYSPTVKCSDYEKHFLDYQVLARTRNLTVIDSNVKFMRTHLKTRDGVRCD